MNRTVACCHLTWILSTMAILAGCLGTFVRLDEFGTARAGVSVQRDQSGIVVSTIEAGPDQAAGVELSMLGSGRKLLVKRAHQFRGIIRRSSANLELLSGNGTIYQLCLTDKQLVVRGPDKTLTRELDSWADGEILVIDWDPDE